MGIKDDIIDDLKSRYPALQRPFWYHLANFFAMYPEEKLNKIYEQVCKNGFYGRLPEIQLFYKAVEQLKIAEIEKAHGDKPYDVYECSVCKAVYDIKSRGCPTCHAMTPAFISTRERSDQFIHLQQDCFECRYKLDPLKVNGPVCTVYGKGRKIPDCARCECAECCAEFSHVVCMGQEFWKKAMIPDQLKKLKGGNDE